MSKVKLIDAQKAKEWLDKDEAIIIDVREPDEYAAMHIAGATLIPLGTLEKDKLPLLGQKKLIIHCQLGKRGAKACDKLLASEPTLEIYNLEGGITAWQKAGYNVETLNTLILSVERQAPIMIGSLILLGVIAGYLIHPVFLIFPLFLGAGLLYEGITGSSGLEELLKDMPWNK